MYWTQEIKPKITHKESQQVFAALLLRALSGNMGIPKDLRVEFATDELGALKMSLIPPKEMSAKQDATLITQYLSVNGIRPDVNIAAAAAGQPETVTLTFSLDAIAEINRKFRTEVNYQDPYMESLAQPIIISGKRYLSPVLGHTSSGIAN